MRVTGLAWRAALAFRPACDHTNATLQQFQIDSDAEAQGVTNEAGEEGERKPFKLQKGNY